MWQNNEKVKVGKIKRVVFMLISRKSSFVG